MEAGARQGMAAKDTHDMGPHAMGGDASRPLVLVTGFGRFPGVRINPTERLAAGIGRRVGQMRSGPRIVTARLTVGYRIARHELDALLTGHRPDAVLLLGLAASTHWVRVERHARQLDSPLHPDALGQAGSQPASSSDLPLSATAALGPALATLRRAGIRSRLSPSAGRYLCNAAYALALARAAGRPTLFVHVPWPRPAPGTRPARRVRGWRPGRPALEAALSTIVLRLAAEARRAGMAQNGLARTL